MFAYVGDTFGRSAIFIPQRSIAMEWLAPCIESALFGICTAFKQLVYTCHLVPDIGTTLAHRF